MRHLPEYILVAAIIATGAYALFMVGILIVEGPHQPQIAVATPATTTDATAASVTSDASAAAEPAAQAQSVAAQSGAGSSGGGTDMQAMIAAGEKAFKKCGACHTVEKDGADKIGPNLWDIVNAPVARREGFGYSEAMAAMSSQTWTFELLDRYLMDVKGTVPGTKMTFAGIKKDSERASLIAYLAQQSDNPADVPAMAATEVAAGDSAETAEAEEEPAFVYSDPPAPSPEEVAKNEAAVAALEAEVAQLGYQRAKYHRLHFKPAIDTASDGECLVCHRDILERDVLQTSPAGLSAEDSLAWYQTLDTYEGSQLTFHQRHITSDFARSVMNLKCNFCHQGNDPREEAPSMVSASSDSAAAQGDAPFSLRKVINPSQTCLLCHGAFPAPEEIMGLPGSWPEVRGDFESEDAPNGCLSCHRDLFRLDRHGVTYLNAATIETLAESSSDVCFGCHGGRQWYRISYPYPRHAWPDMDPEVPEWAVDRPTQSDARYRMDEGNQ